MTTILKPRSILPAIGTAIAALFLIAPAADAKTKTLASTPQYKAFVQYVAELAGKQGQPASAAEKARYTTQLTNKHRAAVNRANGLFAAGKNAARREAQKGMKTAAAKVRRAEAAELAELRGEYADKLETAADAFDKKVGALEDKYDKRYVTLQRQIRALRMKKAKADNLAAKDRIQAQINVIVEQVSDSRRQEREAMDRLRDRYRTQKKAIQEAKAAATAEVVESRQESIQTLRNRWNRVYNTEVSKLQAHRSTQLAGMLAKMDRARAAIASMPLAS